VPILTRYAFGLDARAPNGPQSLAKLPVVGMHEGRAAISFPRFFSATDLDYLVERSSDLIHWVSGAEFVEEVPAERLGWVRYRSKAPANGEPASFLRVRLQR
jgi:hypothetical protein